MAGFDYHAPSSDASDDQPRWDANTPRKTLVMNAQEVDGYCTLQRGLFPDMDRTLSPVQSFLGSHDFRPCEHKGSLARTDAAMNEVTLLCLGQALPDGGVGYKIKIAYVPRQRNWRIYLKSPGKSEIQPYLSIEPSRLLVAVRGLFQ